MEEENQAIQAAVPRKGQRQARCALCVLSCLLPILGMMLPPLFTSLPILNPILDPRHILPFFDHKVKPYHGSEEQQAYGYLMRDHLQEGGCMWPGSGWITGLLLTPDRRLVLTNWHTKTLTVKSSFTENVIHLPIRPLGLTLLGNSSSHVAVTSGTQKILLVDLDTLDGLPPENSITTGKSYSSVTSGLTDTTLIVSTLADGEGRVSIDVITLQGDVIETLMDTARFPDLRYSHFLARGEQKDVLISALDRNNDSTLIRLLYQDVGPGAGWKAEKIQSNHLAGHLWGTAGHRRWGVFIAQDTGVVRRTPADGRFVPVLARKDPYFNPTMLAVAEDRLFVVWDHAFVGDFVMVEYHLHQLQLTADPNLWLQEKR